MAAKYGMSVLSKSRMHLGTSTRIQRVIERALAGKPITISVIGGSVSACHGAGDDPISPKCYPSKFFQWWNTIFPHPATELTNGAMRRSNSDYYGFCASHHIPDVTDLDSDSTDNFEILIRSLLLRPDTPAVLLLGHFSPQIHQTHGFAGPDHWHDLVAQFYDIPHVSSKAALFADYMREPKSIENSSDLLEAYIQSQICTTWDMLARGESPSESHKSDAGALFGGVGLRKGVPGENDEVDEDKTWGINVEELGIPLGRVNTRPLPGTKYEEIAPFCVSANDLINPLPPACSTAADASSANSGVMGHYFYSTLPTSKLRVPLNIGAGDIGIYYIVETVKVAGEGSKVECWVDDNYAGAKTLENVQDIGEARPQLTMIDHYVTRGNHFVECQLLGEEGQGVWPFKIIGIFST
ncbi:hypothetical protein BDQ17DRAFT_1391107 [Cyathus striatus]|nr:hypothetical protein BDQ17DRAFT_1391107 [Cyathus striatus]